MGQKNSLLDYLEKDLGKLVMTPNISRKGSDLERSLVNSYEPVKEELRGLYSEQKDIFDIYLDAGDISKGHVKRYFEALKGLRKTPYKVKGRGGLISRIFSDKYGEPGILMLLPGGAGFFSSIIATGLSNSMIPFVVGGVLLSPFLIFLPFLGINLYSPG